MKFSKPRLTAPRKAPPKPAAALRTALPRLIAAGGFGLTLSACGGGGNSAASLPSYTLGGSISGLSAAGLVLANGSATVSPAANATAFTFSQPLSAGTAYAVVVQTQPAGEFCSVSNGTGTMPGANVDTVAVYCTNLAIGLSAVYVAMDRGQIAGLSADLSTVQVQQLIVSSAVFSSSSPQSGGQIAIDGAGTLYQLGLFGGGEVVALADLGNRGPSVQFDAAQDLRWYAPQGASNALTSPTALALGADVGSLIVGSVANQQTGTTTLLHALSGFVPGALPQSSPVDSPNDVLASGFVKPDGTACNVSAPMITISAVAYDPQADRLFAACFDGSPAPVAGGFVAVYDDFIARLQSGVPAISRTMTPGEASGFSGSAPIGAQLQSLAYDPAHDVLFVGGYDISTLYGSIFIFNQASTRNDAAVRAGVPIVVPDRIIEGVDTQLGHSQPAALVFNQGALLAAVGGSLLQFNNIEAGRDANVAPDLAVTLSTLGLVGNAVSLAVP